MQAVDVAIVGGGPAGLAVATRLADKPLRVVVLERTSAIGDTWAGHYEGLTLNTVSRLSRLADVPFPAAAGMWPGKEDVARYLAGLAKGLEADLRTGVAVERLIYRSAQKLWEVESSQGALLARAVVLATGSNHQPLFPDWVGALPASLPVVHSSQYRSSGAFSGHRVLVVGGGNSGAEIACRVAEAASSVVLSLREAPLVLPKKIGPLGFTYYGLILRHVPAAVRAQVLRGVQRVCLGDHRAYGLPLPSSRYLLNGGKDRAPTFFPGFLSSVRNGKVRVRGAVSGVSPVGVMVQRHIGGSDTETLDIDSVICATGFSPKPAISILHDDAMVSDEVWAQAADGNPNPASTLFALGFVSPISGQFREINRESRKIAAALTQTLAA